MDLTKLLDTLKDKLATAKDFKKVWEYFLDQVEGEPSLMDVGERVEKVDEVMMGLVAAAAQQAFKPGTTIAVQPTAMGVIAAHHFVHGSLSINGLPGAVIYFSDIQVGLVWLMPGRFMRFSGRRMPGWGGEN